ncbi:unnamed protein product [Echinostoma caproni]|uniref:Uncharacterized protein n=1 Tax=Echinostoma caproni TaxID=27848 RepID=A0A182ZZ95_9TREM|nr:unnamed protein product [Echinostoma caproni]
MRYEHMLAKARSMLQQTRLQQQGLAPFTEALPPLANARKPRPLSSSTFSPVSPSASTPTPTTTVTNEEQKFTDMSPDFAGTGFPSSNLRSRPVYQRSSTSTICMTNGGASLSHSPPNPAGTNHLHQSMDIQSPGSAINTSTTAKTPPITAPIQPSPPDGMKVRRLRLSQLNLFASGRGTTAPVPIRQLGDPPQSGFSPSPVHKSKGIPNAHVLPVGIDYSFVFWNGNSVETSDIYMFDTVRHASVLLGCLR